MSSIPTVITSDEEAAISSSILQTPPLEKPDTWFGRTITFISEKLNRITTLFFEAISFVTSYLPSPKKILISIAKSLVPDLEARRIRQQFPRNPNRDQPVINVPTTHNLLERPSSLEPVKPLLELQAIDLSSKPEIYKNLHWAIAIFASNSQTDALFAIEDTRQNPTQETLKGHLMSIINFMRGSTSIEINTTHLDSILILLSRIDSRNFRCVIDDRQVNYLIDKNLLLLRLTEILNGSFEIVEKDVWASCDSLMESINPLSPKETTILAILPGTSVNFEPTENATLKTLKSFVEYIAFNKEGNALLEIELPDPNPSERVITQFFTKKENFLFVNFRQHLGAIVEKIRANNGSVILNSELGTLSKLLNALDLKFSSALNLIERLKSKFAPRDINLESLIKKEVLKFIITSDGILDYPDELAPANSKIVMSQLDNIGLTCYMSSTLWMLAKFNCFNILLTDELPETLSEIEHQTAILLRQHLSGIIHKLRTKQKIDRENLKVLYHLLIVLGWPHPINTMQDSHELLSFLFTKLLSKNAVTPFSFLTAEKFSWQEEDNPELSTKTRQIHELSYEMGLGPQLIQKPGNWLIDPSVDTLEKIYQHNMTTSVEGYRPYDDARTYHSTKQTCVINAAPDTLFVHQKRYILGHRINGQLPIFNSLDKSVLTPFFSVDVFESTDNLQVKETKIYKLTGAICHSGISVNSGHYTFMSLQTLHDDETESDYNAWINYNDLSHQSTPVMFKEGSDSMTQLQKIINEDGYYLIYELDHVEPKGLPPAAD